MAARVFAIKNHRADEQRARMHESGSILIGLMGAAGAGKTTFADRLVSMYGFRAYNFAAPLKRLCAEQFGWDVEQLERLAYKEEQAPGLGDGWTRRRVMQHIGTDGFRKIDPDHWVKRALRELGSLGPKVVIPDVRFPNEAAAITSLGGLVVRLQRADATADTAAAGHESETAGQSVVPDVFLAIPYGLHHIATAVDGLVLFISEMDDAPWPDDGEMSEA